jgi:hypothetical protein
MEGGEREKCNKDIVLSVAQSETSKTEKKLLGRMVEEPSLDFVQFVELRSLEF